MNGKHYMATRLLVWLIALALVVVNAATMVQGASHTKAVPAFKAEPEAGWSYPIGRPGQRFGDGFWIRHGFTVENTWFNPGYWHTGEDWYAVKGDTAGANVYAVSNGVVVYAGANYPGRVVIVQHEKALFSMYGHLDPRLAVKVGQRVVRGELLGTVLKRSDKIPNHLHFEIRTFLTTRIVNGNGPRYKFRCGRNCPPGPGYWPFRAPDLPTAVGWLNPTHVIAGRAAREPQGDDPAALGEVVVATDAVSATVTVLAAPPAHGKSPQTSGVLRLKPGQRFPLLATHVGSETSSATGAQAYMVWYKIQVSSNQVGWVHAAAADKSETGKDGRAASVRFNFLPAQSPP